MLMLIPVDFTGFIAVVKRDCATCRLIEPVLRELMSGAALQIHSQDDPCFPGSIDDVIDERELELSYRLEIEIVPTLIQMQDGEVKARLVGWKRDDWRRLTEMTALGEALPTFSPGCGSKSVEPGMPEKLAYKFGDTPLKARRVEVAQRQDEHELMFERGWSDGLPVVPPTEDRVLMMLAGTTRSPTEIIGIIPPDNVPCAI